MGPDAIKGLRAALGLTQAALADRLGCSTQAVSFWERGTRTPTGLYARAVRALLAEAAAGDDAASVGGAGTGAVTLMPGPSRP